MASVGLKLKKHSSCNTLNSPVLLKKCSRSQKLRAEALGWDGWSKKSFEMNQSFMNNFQYSSSEEKGKVEGPEGLIFAPFESEQIPKQSPFFLSAQVNETSLSDNFSMYMPNPSTSVLLESNSPYISTSKAIFTILLPSSKILVVNSAACQLLNYSSDELCSLNLEDIIQESYKNKLMSLQKVFLKDLNSAPFNNGKMVKLVQKDGESVLVSLYLKKIDTPQRCLAIAEPLDHKAVGISVDKIGKIISCDEEVAVIFQYDSSDLVGVNISTILPAINLFKIIEHDSEVFKQRITGRTKNGDAFPVFVNVTYDNPTSEVFQIEVWAFISLSGMIMLNKELLITNFNQCGIKLLFGFSKKQIVNQPITNFIPTFCKDVTLERINKGQLSKPNFNLTSEAYLSSWYKKLEHRNSLSAEKFSKDDCLSSLRSASLSLNDFSKSFQKFHDCCLENKVDLKRDFDIKTLFALDAEKPKEEHRNIDYFIQQLGNEVHSEKECNTILEGNELEKYEPKQMGKKNVESFSENFLVQEGKFLGLGKHCDGTYLEIKYQVKTAVLNDEVVYTVSLSKDLQHCGDISRGLKKNLTVSSSFNRTSFESSFLKDSNCSEQHTKPSSASIISQCDENLTAGEYSEYYTNIRQIGKGAFGYVKMAYRNSDGLLVVTKFIKKQKINIRSWVFHPNLNMKIPLEVSLLTTLQHPNIVKVLDVFHNDSFVQLVMEKHGAGFDLFEFIDRGPKCDEKLKSYIFRQIISAVHYLNSLRILHRDIKDENVIINEKFEVKLIDFGSATFMPPDETFSKFYGTVEYCSPEVLQGNAYKGPELEIWALGVTLYVLTFGENPFYGIEETIKGQFSIPCPISKELYDLLHKMLDKNVETRITIDELIEDEWINQYVCIENYKFEEVVRCYEEEAYPPKYMSEIRSEELFSRTNSKADSDLLGDTNNSSSSLQNISIGELDDLDDNFQELHKSTKSEIIVQKKNISTIVLSSTPVHKRSDGFCKSAIGLRKCLENSLPLVDSTDECCNNNLASENLNILKQYKGSSPNIWKTERSKDEIIALTLDHSRSSNELEMRFQNCSFYDESDLKSLGSSCSQDLSEGNYEEKNESEEYLCIEDKSAINCCSPD